MGGSPTSQVGLIEASLRVLVDQFGELDATKFGPLALKACREDFVRRGLVRAESNRRTRLIVQCFSWCVEQEFIPESIWSALLSVKALQRGRTEAPNRPAVGTVKDEDVEATLPFMPPVVDAMVKVQALYGARPGEIVVMRAQDSDMSGPVWEFKPQSHKTEHRNGRRVVILGPSGQKVIGEFLRPAIGIHDPARGDSPYVFAPVRRPGCDSKREPGDRYTVNSYRRAIARACARAGVTEWSPNRLRHSAATRLRRKIGLEAARAVLGHQGSDTTLVCAELDDSIARYAAARFG